MSKRKLKDHKIFAALVALILAAAALTGCGASLTVYDYAENGVRYNVYELRIDRDTFDRMEQSAVTTGNGKKYDVPGYFFELFEHYGYELVAAALDGEAYVARYKKGFEAGIAPELYTVGVAPEYTYTQKADLFVRRISAVAEDPFNGVRQAYDDVEPGKSGQIIQQLKNGIISREYGEEKVIFPSVQAAFPYLNGISLDGLLLGYAVTQSSRMDSSAVATDNGDGTSVYTFSRYFDTTDRQLRFDYIRPVPFGWYAVALLVGAAVIAAIRFFTRSKKQKPTLLDRFPYNPEEFRDYDNHLPM